MRKLQAADFRATQATLAGNLNYRYDLAANLWLEPTVGMRYTNSGYGPSGAQLGLQDGYLIMVQGGARVGASMPVFIDKRLTVTLAGLAYDDVVVRGGFLPAGGAGSVNLLAQADEGKVRGRGVLALNLDLGSGVSSYIRGEVRGGEGLFGAGGKVGVRLRW